MKNLVTLATFIQNIARFFGLNRRYLSVSCFSKLLIQIPNINLHQHNLLSPQCKIKAIIFAATAIEINTHCTNNDFHYFVGKMGWEKYFF
jgi:hypothetical protein